MRERGDGGGIVVEFQVISIKAGVGWRGFRTRLMGFSGDLFKFSLRGRSSSRFSSHLDPVNSQMPFLLRFKRQRHSHKVPAEGQGRIQGGT